MDGWKAFEPRCTFFTTILEWMYIQRVKEWALTFRTGRVNHVIYPEYDLHMRSPLDSLSLPWQPYCPLFFFQLGDTHTHERNMSRVRKRDIEQTPDLRRSTRSRGSTSTSTSSIPTPDKVEMRLPILSRKQSEVKSGMGAWDIDFKKLKLEWKRGVVEGYGGLMATINGMFTARLGAEVRFQIRWWGAFSSIQVEIWRYRWKGVLVYTWNGIWRYVPTLEIADERFENISTTIFPSLLFRW